MFSCRQQNPFSLFKWRVISYQICSRWLLTQWSQFWTKLLGITPSPQNVVASTMIAQDIKAREPCSLCRDPHRPSGSLPLGRLHSTRFWIQVSSKFTWLADSKSLSEPKLQGNLEKQFLVFLSAVHEGMLVEYVDWVNRWYLLHFIKMLRFSLRRLSQNTEILQWTMD